MSDLTLPRRTMFALGAAAVVAEMVGCSGMSEPGPAPPRQPSSPRVDLEDASMADLARRLDRGEVTAVSLVEGYLERIEAIDRRGPALRSILEIDPNARAIAAALDAERRAKGPRSPLHGVPIVVKDNIDTAGPMLTTAGSRALSEAPAPADATIVQKLRAAGAVILGKTNLSEWANIRSSKSTSGWSARGGLTKNPHALDRNTSGSSSGSAAAIAAGLAAGSLGTETDGSIVSPSSICGIVGLKPTVGLVSRAGIIPISASQDTAGPMTRTVEDAAMLLSAIAGPDPRDKATLIDPRAAPSQKVDYLRALQRDAAKGKRIGVVRNINNLHPKVVEAFNASVRDMASLGAVMIDVELLHLSEIDPPEMTVLLVELRDGMAQYLASRGPACPYKTLDDLVKYNRAHAAEELRYFGQELFEQALTKGPIDAPAYRDARALCLRLMREEGIDALLQQKKLDLLMAPTGGVAWTTDLVNGDAFTGSSSTPAAVAGYPSITVPAGALFGLPIGVSFFAGAYSEPLILAVAYAYEQATKRRIKPGFLPTLELR